MTISQESSFIDKRFWMLSCKYVWRTCVSLLYNVLQKTHCWQYM